MPCAPAPGGVDAEHRYVPGTPVKYGSSGEPWPEQQLAQRRRPADDVATDVVRVGHGHLGRRAHRSADDPLAEAGGEPFDLGDDRLRRVARVAVRHMGVASTTGSRRRPSGPGRRGTAGRRARTVAPASCRDATACSLASDLGGGAAQVDGAGAGGPPAAVHGTSPSMAKSTLNAPGPCAEPAVRTGDPTRQAIAEDAGGDRRRDVEHQHVVRRKVGGGRRRGRPSRSCRRGARCRRPARRRSPASRPPRPPIPCACAAATRASSRPRWSSGGRAG